MHRPNMSPGMGPRGPRGGFRGAAADNGARLSFGQPRYGQFMGSPNHSPRGFHGGSEGKERSYNNFSSPAYTPRRDQGGPPHRNYSNYSPGPRMAYQDSPRTSTPFRSPRGRESVAGVEKYYSPTMLQDPWASLQPVASAEHSQSTHTPGRYC